MSNKRHSHLAAFTLIELLAALAVLSMLVIMLFMAFSNANRMMIMGSNQMEKNQVVRAVLQQIARDLERAAYSGASTNLYATTPTELLPGISNSTLYCLSTLSLSEGNTNGSVVNVGYQIATNETTVYGTLVNKLSLFRGDDAGVRPGIDPTDWYTPAKLNNRLTFWKPLSDNIVGIAFQFYTNTDNSAYATNADNYVTGWNDDPLPLSPRSKSNCLPTSVGITIWAIDSANYNLALNPNLTSAVSLRILTNSTHKYTSRVFLPQSTQNP